MRTFILNRVLIAGLVSCCWLAPVYAVENVARGKAINVMTRYMMIFSELENSLLSAQASGNQQQVKLLLSPFFEFNSHKHQSLPLDAFLARPSDSVAWQISRMRVYEVGPNAIVYFSLSAKGRVNRTLVDVWEPYQQSWQLRVRFESNE